MGNSFRVLPMTALILFVLGPALSIAAAGDRQPMPPAAQLTRAEATIKKLFKDEYERRTPADRQALARKLLGEGQATPNDAAARYVCYREASSLATLGGDLPTAFMAMNAMAKDFAVDPRDLQKMKVATYITVAKQVETPEANAALAEVGLNLLSHMLALENFDDVDRLLAPIEAAATKTKQLALVTRVQSSRDQATELRRDAQKSALAVETLKKTPGDPEANLTLGRHLAFVKGYWDDALPLLAKSSDPTLKNLAQKELAKPADAKSLVQLADGWWDVSEKQTGLSQTILRRHAQEEYQRAFPRLAGLEAARVSTRLPAEAPTIAAALPPAEVPAASAAPVSPAAMTQPAVAQGDQFWWTGNVNPHGIRVWRKIDATTWEESSPTGTSRRFNVISQDEDPTLGAGTVVRCATDPTLEVFVPKLATGNLILYRFLRPNQAKQWQRLALMNLGAPPAATAQPGATTQPAAVAQGDEVTKYWWTTQWKPPGLRIWHKTAADTWEEVDSEGTVKRFRVVSHDDPQLGPGTVVRNWADPALEVWVPKLVDGNMTYFRRSDRDNQWNVMGGIHVGDPPAAEAPPAQAKPPGQGGELLKPDAPFKR
jgi:hypothetical protein